MSHTATPFRTTQIKGEVRDQHGFVVADCQKQEDAEFIVRACNGLDIALAALKMIEEDASRPADPIRQQMCLRLAHEAQRKINDLVMEAS